MDPYADDGVTYGMPDVIMPVVNLESRLVDEPRDSVAPHIQISVRCVGCLGSGLDPAKVVGGSVVSYVERADDVHCGACDGTGRVKRWISAYDLQRFVVESVAAGMADLISMMKEQSVRDVMES